MPPSYTFAHTTSGGEISDPIVADEQIDAPRIAFCIHDGLELVTRVEVVSDGSISIIIYDHPTQPRTPRAPVRVNRHSNPFPNRRPSSPVSACPPLNPFHFSRAAAIVAAQERMRRARSARAPPRSTRTWNLRDAVAQANNFGPSIPPPTYQEVMRDARAGRGLATFVQPPSIGTSDARVDSAHSMDQTPFTLFSFSHDREKLPVYSRYEHGTSSEGSTQESSPVSSFAEPHQFPSSSSPITPLYPAPKTLPEMPGTPRIEGQQPDERNPLTDLLI